MFSDKKFSMALKKEMSQYFKIDTQTKTAPTTKQKTIEETTKREMKSKKTKTKQ